MASRRHEWETKNEWMLFHHGVVPAIASVIETFTTKGDGILITPPVYPPFFQIPGLLERNIVECVMMKKMESIQLILLNLKNVYSKM